MKHFLLSLLAFALSSATLSAKDVTLSSPDGRLSATISASPNLSYSVSYDDHEVIAPSQISLTLADGKTVGRDCSLSASKPQSVDGQVPSPLYRSATMTDRYNAVTVKIAPNWKVEFRAYDDAIAYRFVSLSKKPFEIKDEQVQFNFPSDVWAAAPYVNIKNFESFEPQFGKSFENTYTTGQLSTLDARRLIFLPMAVKTADSINVLISEADFYGYPGMYLNKAEGNSLRGVFAPYPKSLKQGGHNNLQMRVTDREDFIAKIDGPRNLPWRIAVVTPEDARLAATNVNYLLGQPSKLEDISWIKPGKVAWDWWSDFTFEGVDFRAGINTATYKAYIDFASRNGVEYVILDEGWAVNKKADLFQVVPEIDLQEIVDYGKSKNVGIILWAGYWAFDRDLEKVCKHFADMGVKGFKVDFMDRDDQQMTEFFDRAAQTCARYGLVLDFHGAFKPGGLNRTYPNVLNHEGVFGLEQMKWSKSADQVEYDVMIPFIRQVAGPLDYTQGAMRNANKKNYFPCNSEPMSQGTRCRQLAMYMVFDSPLTMLCDSPSNYDREEECTEFIAGVPTVWDETVVLDGKMGDYIVTARCKGDTWYVGGMTDWTPRDLTVDLSFLQPGRTYQAQLFTDGVNADRLARDYKRTDRQLTSADRLTLHLAPGGGFALRLR